MNQLYFHTLAMLLALSLSHTTPEKFMVNIWFGFSLFQGALGLWCAVMVVRQKLRQEKPEADEDQP
jgi:hypothetical protein